MSNQEIRNTNGRLLRAVIYARVSSDKQEEDGTGLDTQVENCTNHALANGMRIIETFREVFTGSLYRERSLLTKLRQMARNKEFDVIIINTFDRLSRNQTHLAVLVDEMDHLGIKIDCVKEKIDDTITGEFLRNALGFVAEMERLKIVERTDTGRRKRVIEKGKIIPGWKPRYGYVWAGDQKDDKQRMELNQQEAEVVVHIFDLYVYQGQSCRRVSLTLEAESIPSPTGKKAWNESTVRRILSDPTYIGKGGGYKYTSIKEKGKYSSRRKDPSEWLPLPEGTFPQIVDEETFNKAQEKLELNKVDSARNNPEAKLALLRCGFVKCAYCKRIMCATRNIGGTYNPERHKFGYSYKCGWRYRGNSRCERACSIAVDELDAIVWNYVGEILKDFTLVEQAIKLASSSNSSKADLLSVNRSLKIAKEAQDEFVADLKEVNADGMLKLRGRAKDLVLDQIDQLQQRIDELEETRLEIERGKDNWKEIEEEINKFLQWVLASKEIYESATYEEKRRAIRMLGITVFVYSKSDTEHPERYEIKLKVPDIVRHTV